MIQKGLPRPHGVLVVAEERQGIGYEGLESLERLLPRRGPAEPVEIAEMIGKARSDERHHVARGRVGLEAQPFGRREIRRQGFAVLGIEVPPSSCRLAVLHEETRTLPHDAIEMLHAEAAAPFGPASKVDRAAEEAIVGPEMDRDVESAAPAFYRLEDAELARFGDEHFIGQVAAHRPLEFARE